MTLKQLARNNGVSLSTARRYQRAGIDLTNHWAVKEHKFKQRTRRGLSKLVHRTMVTQQAVAISTRHLEATVLDLENRICGMDNEIEFFARRHPELAAELADARGYAAPVIARIVAEE